MSQFNMAFFFVCFVLFFVVFSCSLAFEINFVYSSHNIICFLKTVFTLEGDPYKELLAYFKCSHQL